MMNHKTTTTDTTFTTMNDAYYTVTEGCSFPLMPSTALWNTFASKSGRKHTNAARKH